MPKPTPMKYTTQAIICLCNDLSDSARARQVKREEAGDGDLDLTIGTAPARTVKQSKLFLNGGPNGALPAEYRLTNSRLIIFGHGCEQSTHIKTDSGWITPVQLARKIKTWLNGSRIKHISLQMCYGGGNRANAGWTDFANWAVRPSASFVYELARHCRYGATISARTGVANFNTLITQSGQLSRTDDYGDPTQVTFTTVDGRYKQLGDKLVYTTNNNATPDNPVDPDGDISFPSSTKAKPW